jgi:iron complex outermembrane recepter protein
MARLFQNETHENEGGLYMYVHATGRNAGGAVLVGCLGLLLNDPSSAQERTAGPGMGLEEVIVTARKRDESLQEVPIAITAITSEELREKSIESPYDIAYHTPGIAMRAADGTRESVQFFLRGLAGVVTYFSDAPLTFGQAGGGGQGGGANIQFFDLASVQVVKGPQGTLFGRSSTGGAVLFTPQHPTDEFEGFFNASVGNYDMREFSGALNIPLIDDKLAMRVAGISVRRDGYTKSLTTGQKQDDRHRDSVRVGLSVTPTEWLDSYFLFQDNRVNENSTGNLLIDWNPGLALFQPAVSGFLIGGVCGALNPGNPAGAATCNTQRRARIAELVSATGSENARVVAGDDDDLRDNVTGQRNLLRNQNQQLLNITTIKVGELPVVGDLSFKNILSTFRTRHNTRIQDLGATIFGHGANYTGYDLVNFVPTLTNASEDTTDFMDAFSEEFQIQGDIGGKHNWILGFYTQEVKNDFSLPSLFGNFGNIFSITLDTPGPAGGVTTDSLSIVKGYFGQFTVDLSEWVLDGLHFTGGYRWSETSSRSETFQAVITPTGIVAGPRTASPRVLDEAPTWTASIDYQINPGLLAYITHRRGFNPGGINIGINADIPGAKLTFDPETVDDLEIGMKYDWELMGRPIRTNVSAYRNWYNDVQRIQTLQNPNFPFNTFTQTNNIAKAEITGLEFEGVWAATERLSIGLNYSWMDAKNTKWPGTTVVNCASLCPTHGQTVDLVNSPFVGAPKHQGTLGVRYKMPLGPTLGDLTGAVDYFRQTEVQTNDQFLQTGSRVGLVDGYGNLNLRLDWSNIAGQPVDLGLFVRNATDEVHLLNVGSLYTALGTVLGTYSEPRMWGAELRYRFGEDR